MNDEIEHILRCFRERGSESYGTEAVTQLQHALQCATCAVDEGADDELVAAALLHDLGHIFGEDDLPMGLDENLDDRHELRAYKWIDRVFGDRIADCVRLHVDAKRYLCTVDPAYAETLSPTSLKSFHDQGGVMDDAARTAFEAEPHFEDAVRLRRWDDTAKDPARVTRPVEDFLGYLERSAR